MFLQDLQSDFHFTTPKIDEALGKFRVAKSSGTATASKQTSSTEKVCEYELYSVCFLPSQIGHFRAIWERNYVPENGSDIQKSFPIFLPIHVQYNHELKN